ncbi:hemerythrin domain-containing protein [Phytomonospora sp. NPDC050363]|uniref:hemerythrin domain-containing protein n=1 Tax=Phytomonospora sp. NPDC050363 TaxID=3155642 RepID=UPI0033F900E1
MTTTDHDGRLAAFGNQLVAVHVWLREELAALADGVDAYLSGGGERPRELRVHCLTFCSVLTRHHTEEDGEVFGAVAARFPELAPVLDELRADHVMVSDTLDRIKALVEGLDEGTDPGEALRVGRELDTLSALLETHFLYEEKKIVEALNALGAGILPDDVIARVLPGP